MRSKYPNFLKRHERTHTDEKPYHCSFCDMKFSQSYPRKLHILTHLCKDNSCKKCTKCKNQEAKYSCKICSKNFNSLYNLQVHERIHTGEKPYACSICNLKFTRSYHQKRHEITHLSWKYLYKEKRSHNPLLQHPLLAGTFQKL